MPATRMFAGMARSYNYAAFNVKPSYSAKGATASTTDQ